MFLVNVHESQPNPFINCIVLVHCRASISLRPEARCHPLHLYCKPNLCNFGRSPIFTPAKELKTLGSVQELTDSV